MHLICKYNLKITFIYIYLHVSKHIGKFNLKQKTQINCLQTFHLSITSLSSSPFSFRLQIVYTAYADIQPNQITYYMV